MEADSSRIKKIVYEKLLQQENVEFFNSLDSKEKAIDEEIRNLENKKIEIIAKINENKQKVERDPKDLRNHINNSESVLESVDRIFKNLNDLISLYRSIEKSLTIVSEKYELNPQTAGLEDDIEVLIAEVAAAKSLEITTKADNERNYIIVKNYLNRPVEVSAVPEEEFADQKVSNIPFEDLTLDNLTDNMVLRICKKRVELPYTKREVEEFMKTYPEDYKTVQDVITKEFMVNISIFNKHPILSRFREAYFLCRTKEMLSIYDSFNYAKSIMFRSDINSSVIAAVKSKKQLEEYIDCLEHNRLDKFKYFKIIFEINPLSISF